MFYCKSFQKKKVIACSCLKELASCTSPQKRFWYDLQRKYKNISFVKSHFTLNEKNNYQEEQHKNEKQNKTKHELNTSYQSVLTSFTFNSGFQWPTHKAEVAFMFLF